jgi:hypothetical protein
MARLSKEAKAEKDKLDSEERFEKLFVPLKQCKALVKLGFKAETLTCYYPSKKLETELEYLDYNKIKDCIPAFVWDQAFNWFDTKHKLEFYIRKEYGNRYGFKLWNGINYFAEAEGKLDDVKIKALDILIKKVKDGKRKSTKKS